MKNSGNTKSDKLSELSALLNEVEAEHVDNNDGGAHGAREAIVKALPAFRQSRYAFGKLLADYKVFFIGERGWGEASKAIGGALGCDARTICRIVEDYGRASQLPVEVINELVALGIDPAAKKNEAAISNLVTMDPPAVKADPKKAAAVAVEKMNATKAEKKAKAATKPVQTVSVTGDTEIVLLKHEEKQRFDIRMKIRSALTNIPDDGKLAELIAALEEEMYEVWSQHEPVRITITPRASALTLDGRRKLEEAA
jgi:hypothetical protein